MRVCPTCHAEYTDQAGHNCPLKSGALGAWGASDQPEVAVAEAPSPEGTPVLAPHLMFDGTPHTQMDHVFDPEGTGDFRFHVEKQVDPNIGKVIAERYKIISLVGRGGMGMVYKADHLTIDRTVAIKMLYTGVVADAEAVKRFKGEAQAISKVEHPHSVRIYDFGMSDLGQPYLVMDFVEGGSLRQLVKDAPLNIGAAEEIFSQVCDALAFAHKVGVIHRDLKPENIMLCERSGRTDWVQVVDFGISSLGSTDQQGATRNSETRGSPPYMSPEQCTKGALIDHRSDIYSLSIVLFECLSGRLPFGARTPLEMFEAHIAGKPMPLTAANQSLAACQALSDMLMKAMEKSPERRHQSIEEFSTELKEAVRRDSIRLSFLKNRKDTLSGVSGLGAPTASSTNPIPALGPNTTGTDMIAMPGDQRFDLSLSSPTHSLPSLEYSGKSAIIASPDALKKDKNIWQALVNTLSNIQPEGEELPADSGKFVFQNCPHCGDPVEPDIAFCLACGRSLTNTQDFSKIRAQQGVFTLPKGADTASTPVPAFSHKTRAVSPVSHGIRQANKSLMLISFILLISIFWVTGGVDFVAKTVAKMMASQ